MKQHVYFVLADKTRLVKVGIAGDVKRRFYSIRSHSPDAVTLLGVVRDGGREMERHLHALFAAKRVRGEWFHYDAEVESIIRRLMDDGAPSLREQCGKPSLPTGEDVEIWLTPSEMNDVRLVAAFRNTDLSNLLRDSTLAEIAEHAEQIRKLPIAKAS